MTHKFIPAKAKLEKESKFFDQEYKVLLTGINKACQASNEERARFNFEHLLRVNRVRKIIDDLGVLLTGRRIEKPVYTLGSWFLYDCYQYLMKNPVEAIHYVTGLELDNVFALDKIVPFKMEKQSPAFVSGDIISSHRALMRMDEYGHRLHAWFHSHPGAGAGATYPSGTDMSHQERLERGGYPAIGGIFTKDGFVRFFSARRDFELIVHGKEVERIDQKTFRLNKIR